MIAQRGNPIARYDADQSAHLQYVALVPLFEPPAQANLRSETARTNGIASILSIILTFLLRRYAIIEGAVVGGAMRIPPRKSSTERTEKLRLEIDEAATPPRPVGRICGERCAAVCPQCGSTACQCQCSADCPEAMRALSVEPDQYPIEPAILPLVFEMKRLGLFTPCWSCEGHLGHDDTLWKLPRVWFYCDSTTHVRLLADGLKGLEFDKKLSTRWQVAVTHSEADNPTTTFSLEPAPTSDGALQLPALQRDVTVIARTLESMMTAGAADLKQAMDKPLGPGR